jgi:aryl-alcohol dehydrogenase-like predicted oxidoreductase
MAGLAFAWLLAEPRLTAAVVGPARPEHLEPVREALAHPLEAADRAELSRLFG